MIGVMVTQETEINSKHFVSLTGTNALNSLLIACSITIATYKATCYVQRQPFHELNHKMLIFRNYVIVYSCCISLLSTCLELRPWGPTMTDCFSLLRTFLQSVCLVSWNCYICLITGIPELKLSMCARFWAHHSLMPLF